MWLKVFDLVEVESHFFDIYGELKKSVFRFNDKLGIHDEKVEAAAKQQSGTLINLVGFDENYRKQVPSKGEAIAMCFVI